MKSSLLLVLVVLAASDGFIRSRFRNIKCTALNETMATFKYCFLKAYSRDFVSINWGITRHLPFEKPLEVKLKIFYRYGNIYREVLHAEFELCSLLDGTSKNIMANAFVGLLRTSAPQLFTTCPYPIGFYENKNISMEDKNWPSPIPSGFYRTSFTFDSIYNIQYDSEIVSDVKTSF